MKKSFAVTGMVLCVWLAGMLPALQASASNNEMPEGGIQDGIVRETVTKGRYTYVRIHKGELDVWVAGPKVDIKAGDKVSVAPGIPMKDFASKGLNRKFDLIYFVGGFQGGDTRTPPQGSHGGNPHGANPHGGSMPGMGGMPTDAVHEGLRPAGHERHESGHAAAAQAKVARMDPPEGGVAIDQLVAQRKEFAGKQVTVRGQVTRAVSNVMKLNWYHVSDGSGKEGNADLTVASDIVLKKGDTVTLTGVVVVDRDLGFGYRYDILLEKAKVVGDVEPATSAREASK